MSQDVESLTPEQMVLARIDSRLKRIVTLLEELKDSAEETGEVVDRLEDILSGVADEDDIEDGEQA